MIFHSSIENSYLWLPLIGFTIGFFASVIGSGGGFFFLPALILLYNVPAQTAVATSLAATLPICIVGSIGHFRSNHIYLRIGLIFALAGIFGAVAGAGLSNLLTSGQLKTGFGIYSLFIALQILISTYRIKKFNKTGAELPGMSGSKKKRRGSYYGFMAGMVTGTFGTSGAAPVLAGLLSMHIPLKVVAGTSLMIITVTTFAALSTHFLIGKIDLTLVGLLTSGAVIGAFTGPRFLAGIKTDRVESPARVWYAVGLLIFGTLLIAVN
ncbi:MAG: sulfite exporter TauE/SafE family protein [Bacteroidota bacterium]